MAEGTTTEPAKPESKRTLLGILAILLGGIGVHKFMMGKTTPGIIHIVLFFCVGLSTIIGLIEGIIYLTKTDAEFEEIYIKGGKDWF